MSDENQSAVPRSFWIIAGVALVWNLLGVGAYFSHVMMTEEAIMQLPEAEQMLYQDLPAWATAAFAVAVFGGALGCLLLLLRKALATPVFILSLAGIVVQMYHSFAIANTMEVYGPGSTVMPAMVLVIGILLVWYARHATARGWIS
jgi:hypothetical protein